MNDFAALEAFGWCQKRAAEFSGLCEPEWFPARIIRHQSHPFGAIGPHGEIEAFLPGSYRHQEISPVVGDWVALRQDTAGSGVITQLLSRWTLIRRKTAGHRARMQDMAANVDTIFVMSSLNRDLNLRRLERYLVMAWESGARPVVLLTKSDLCSGLEKWVLQVEDVAPGVPVHALSPLTGDGLDSLLPYLRRGQTIACLGSSGVGKSTLVNRLLGRETIATGDIRESDDRGRHTTTHRECYRLPGGGIVIDTPGLREIQVASAEAGFGSAFEDIEILAESCRFRDCRHEVEPDCAVLEAVGAGKLDSGRFHNYLKIRQEMEFNSRRDDPGAAREKKRKDKIIHRVLRGTTKGEGFQ